MNAVELLKKYRSVAEFLSDNATMAVLDSMVACLERKQYYLPFIGQFSAGKSKLINRLIGKDVLPTKSIETTAFLTYVSYAEKEVATLEYVDGTSESIDVARIKELDHQCTQGSKPIAALRYFAPIELLKSGLVIVDTPGVNTLITEHVKITEELLQNSLFVVYVTASSLTDFDKQMVHQLEELDINTVFARTHIDEVHEAEENVHDTIESEKKTIEAALGYDIDFFPLCNESQCSDFECWTNWYDTFQECLFLLAHNVEKRYEGNAINRLKGVKEKFDKALIEKQEFIKQHAEKSDSEITEVIAELSKQKKNINTQLDAQCNEIKDSSNRMKLKLQNELLNLTKKSYTAFNNKIESSVGVDDLLSNSKALFESSLPIAVNELSDYASSVVGNWRDSVLAEIKKDIQVAKLALQSFDITIDTDFDTSSILAYEQMLGNNLSDIAEKYYQLKQLNEVSDDELASFGTDKKKVEELIQQYETLISQGNQEIQAAIANYVPQYVESGGKLGRVLKKVGVAADIAMLFIPAAGWSKAGTFLAQKAGSLAKHGSAIAQYGSKVLTELSAGAKMMSVTDSVLDTTKLISYAKAGGSQKSSGIFGCLSLAYWFEKAGDLIDPLTYVEDEKYKREYEAIVKQKKAEVDLILQQKRAMRQKWSKISEEEELKRIEQQERAKEEAKMQQALQEEQKSIQQKKEKHIKTTVLQQFDEKLNNYTQLLISRTYDEVDSIAENVCGGIMTFINSQLEEIDAELNGILKKRSSEKFNVNEELNSISYQLTQLEIPNE